ncbi:cofactor assembly of complex C subunit B [Prochlorococcus sp. MIT 1223]|uniref:cofactor assembly of complex C subunit B n=1 Tax=Prochlorococcus sp. MIT 1223 TaxID=3096217 RepID=UPI002A74C9B4|nr:cofactor assembly of complex C subunit B [Prochlorococcus sp. MIT 1223]
MLNFSGTFISAGLVLLIMSIINFYFGTDLAQSYQRAEILACISSIVLVGVGLSLRKIEPNKPEKVKFENDQGIYIDDELDINIKNELAWGSKLILTATPAASMLIYFNNKIILRRGYITKEEFIPGRICKSVSKRQKFISLANTKNYPDSYEFDSITPGLPSVLVYPLFDNGYIIIGGFSVRCFSKSDEIWISGWTEKINNLIELNC